jgi:hypothetical protein
MHCDRRSCPGDAETLRRRLHAALDGSEADHRAVLEWAAARARHRFAAAREPETRVQAALLLLHEIRHTYQPARCPVRWVDSILAIAAGA